MRKVTTYIINLRADISTTLFPESGIITNILPGNNKEGTFPYIQLSVDFDPDGIVDILRTFRVIHDDNDHSFRVRGSFTYDETKEKNLGLVLCTKNGSPYPVFLLEKITS